MPGGENPDRYPPETMTTEEPPDAFYTLLGVSKAATDEELRTAYRRLSLLYHPDKHREPAAKATASTIFARINRAYSTLSTPHLRRLYDEGGESALAAAQQVGPCDELAALRAAIHRRLRRKAQLQGQLRQRTHLTAGIDATALTEDWSPIAESMHWSDYLPSVNSFAVSHQLSGCPFPKLAPQVTANGTYSVSLLNGSGGGSLTGILASPLTSKLRTRWELAVGSENGSRRLGWGLTASVHPRLNLDMLLGTRLWGGTLLPSYQVSATGIIRPNVMLSGTVFPQGLAISLGARLGGDVGNQSDSHKTEEARNHGDSGEDASPNDHDKGMGVTLLRTSLIYNWMEGGGRWSGEGRLSVPLDTRSRRLHLHLAPMDTVQLALGVASSRWSASLEIGALFGVGLRFGIPLSTVWGGRLTENEDGDERDSEDEEEEELAQDSDLDRRVRLSLPIYISRELSTQSLLLAIALPSLLGIFFENFVLEPWRRAARKRAWIEWRAQQQLRLAARREEATRVHALMEVFYPRRVEGERGRDGLVITKAIYMGNPMDDINLDPKYDSEVLDVHVPLQMAIVDSQLQLPGGVRKADLLGFYDVAPGQRKTLLIEYTFRSRPHRVLVDDEEALLMPLRQHLLA